MTGKHRSLRSSLAARLRQYPILAATGGAAALEFAFIAPIFLLMLTALFDLGHMAYAQAMLRGAVERAARTSSLETGDTGEADLKVEEALGPVLPGAEFESTRTSYFDFDDIGRPEAYNDSNDNSICDEGETFIDENGNGFWDRDIGKSGNGGANDVVVYQVRVSYKPAFAIPLLAQGEDRRTISARAVKKNQPFANQNDYGSDAGSCD